MTGLEEQIRAIVRDELAKQKPVEKLAEHVTVAEYARARSISESTVRLAIRERRLPSIHIGRAVRVPRDAAIARRDAQSRVDRATERARARMFGGAKVF